MKKVRFNLEVKQHDGLRPATRIIEVVFERQFVLQRPWYTDELHKFIKDYFDRDLFEIQNANLYTQQWIQLAQIYKKQKRKLPLLLFGGGQGYVVDPPYLNKVCALFQTLQRLLYQLYSDSIEHTLD